MNDFTEYIDRRWELDADRPRDGDVRGLDKKRFAYRIWKEDFEIYRKREDAKEYEIKNNWTEIYQLIGFDNVFQGVWFQGVAQLGAQRGCRFSAIPIILSVFVSLATIVAVNLKISKVQALEESLHKDQILTKGLQSCISECESEGVNFDFVAISYKIANAVSTVGNEFDNASVVSRIKSIILLVSLTIASILFAWLIGLIMCGKYV